MKKLLPKISQKKLLTFSVFLLIATLFWFLNAYSREYSANLKYKIEYKGVPESFTSGEKLPEELIVTVKASGFNLFWLQNQNKKVVVDLKKHGVYDKNDKTKMIFFTSKIRDNLVNDTLDIQIRNIEPKYIIINTQKVISKNVPIVSNIKIQYKDLYMPANELKIEPDSVTIYAVKDILSKITKVETKEMSYNEVEGPIEDIIDLKPIENVNFSSSKVHIFVPVEKYTENVIKVKIEIQNCPKDYKIITFPGDVSVKFKVVLSRYEDINRSDFKAFIDYQDIIKNKPSKIKVSLKEYPEFIRDIVITPEYVEYLTEKID